MSIFREYDIRGIYPEEINEEIFYEIGLRLKELNIRKIAVGRDARLSSESLFDSFSKGLIDSGVNVIDVGVLTSPMLSFYCVDKKIHGAMITASHNPKEFNGLKFIDELGIQLNYENILNKIERLLERESKKNTEKGKIAHYDIYPLYRNHFIKSFDGFIKRKLKVVFDCSNGVGGIPLTSMIQNFNMEAVIINELPIGSFPNHSSDQTKRENFIQLQESVSVHQADLGVMFDGDADRCAFIDEKGEIVPMDLAFLILAIDEVEQRKTKNCKILYDLRFSRAVKEILEIHGAKPIIMRVGNPFYKKKMHLDHSAILSGELSGHIMYSQNYSIDDALFASLKMVSLLSRKSKTFSEMIREVKKYFSSEEISIKVKNQDKVMNSIKRNFKKEKELFIDGISVIKKEIWFNIRKSNTENLIRFEIEGISKESVEKQKKELIALIKEYD